MKKKISVVTSAYNEAECIEELAQRLADVFDQLSDYECEAIVVENGSEDDTFERLEEIRARDPRFKILQLARNFRMDGGLTAGLAYADGDAVVFMTADLQDPPEMIPKFVAQWEAGYENVYGIVTARRGTGRMRSINSRMFYWVIGKLTGHLIPANASDFRLLDRPRRRAGAQHGRTKSGSCAAWWHGWAFGPSASSTNARSDSQAHRRRTPSA